jgi:hypothetical protein
MYNLNNTSHDTQFYFIVFLVLKMNDFAFSRNFGVTHLRLLGLLYQKMVCSLVVLFPILNPI